MRAVFAAAIASALVAGACAPASSNAVPSRPTTTAASLTPAVPSSAIATVSPTASATRTPAPGGTRTPAPVPAFADSDLVVRVDLHGDTAGRFATVVVSAAGVYVTAPTDWSADRTVRRLDADGVRLVRDRIMATRLFGADASYGPVLKPGAQPPGHGVSGLVISVWNGTRVVRVSTTLLIPGDEPYYDATPEGATLAALAQALRAPEAWLPATAWRDPTARPYVAPYYRIVTGGMQAFGPDAPFDLSFVAWPFATRLASFGEVVVSSGQVPVAGPQLWFVDGPVRCMVLGRDDALLIRDALFAARSPIWTYAGDAFAVQGVLDGRSIALIAEPMLPASMSCAQELF